MERDMGQMAVQAFLTCPEPGSRTPGRKCLGSASRYMRSWVVFEQKISVS